MKINTKMRTLLSGVAFDEPLVPSLAAIAQQGFTEDKGCFLLVALISYAQNVQRSDFPDDVGYECFVNSIHIEDHEKLMLLPQALQFVDSVFEVWDSFYERKQLIAIVSSDEGAVNVKFHVKRNNQQWLSDDIERNIDAILLASSSQQKSITELLMYK
ncbi:hypothetical protein QBK93_35920 [Rhizobium leguminosarum]|uniref:hypothetical protein n=1 Tax=Rhizobium leguminosarum TaxID=384 RepID=UPI0024A8DCAD|nr:hypothetical protein [Rhizobium leguminosarum]MDI5929991.1 hypothetical protein [Rhizobium leguminosarum]